MPLAGSSEDENFSTDCRGDWSYSGGNFINNHCNFIFGFLLSFRLKAVLFLQGLKHAQGLGVFKLDWMSVWKFIVPYRDPSLLPRQWRIALGTQKSYKQDAAKKEKRRVYESRKRKSKATLANWQLASDKEVYFHLYN